MIVLPALIAATLFGLGVYLLLQRTLVAGGDPGDVPIIGDLVDPESAADPLPQALALTAIVIAFAVTAFLLALAYRSWVLTGDDQVEDDVEDRRIAQLGDAEVRRWWRRPR
jgi:multicomponent Na+:H+ antiporter subunit C